MKKVFSLLLAGIMVLTSLNTNMVDAADYGDSTVWGDFTNGYYQGSNLSFEDSSTQAYENYTYMVSKGGVSARHIDNNKYAYFKVNNNAITSSDNNLFIQVTYYDEGSSGFQIQYNGIGDNYKQATVDTSNSGTWQTTTLCLDQASFRKAQNGGNDFRIWGRGNFGTTISKITITKQSVNPAEEPVVNLYRDTIKSEFSGKTFAGYQGWFDTGDQYTSWTHYAYGGAESDGTRWPRQNNISIDIFPDVTEYADSSLSQTGFANMGNGNSTKLFTSHATDVMDTHFKWMKDYGVDGAAIQRFVGGLTGRTISNTPEQTQMYQIQRAAEKNDRLVYVMYDISGGSQITDSGDQTSISSYVKDMEFDWVYNVEQSLKMLNSDSYATVNGKPVVCVWGFGFADANNTRPSRRVDYQEIINFFHARGCYVIIGIPRLWREQSEYLDIYSQADMISPWYVGALGDESGVDWIYKNNLEPDLEKCQEWGVDYLPVIFSGFSWTLWENGKPNMIPRNKGQLLWYQAYKLKQLGVTSAYIGMFDEYDEGTAIAKAATDYFDIPTDQYFVTTSADGYYLSSDFYLRTAGEAIKMLKGQREAVRNNPVTHSEGPVYYRNSFESRYAICKESQYNGYYPIDPCFKNDGVITADNVSASTKIVSCDNKTESAPNNAKSGNFVSKISGNAYGNSTYEYKISEPSVKVKKSMKLTYSVYANDETGKNTYVELICDDGTRIRSEQQRGIVGQWTDCELIIGKDNLVGKNIVSIALCYAGGAGTFEAYYDNIMILAGDGSTESGSGNAGSGDTGNPGSGDTDNPGGDTPASGEDYGEYYAGNPIISNMFTADPSAHVWEANGRIYIYASHDIFPSRGCDLMDNYHVFSSDNMVTWRDEGQILSSEDVSWGRPEGGFMWAPDAALKDGTYYFYFPHPTGSGDLWNSTWRIGVATSKSPAGGFTCADDGYIKKKDGTPYVTNIDPCVFQDDDGKYYLYTGGGANCHVARLSDDMTTLAEEPVKISDSLTDFHEGMWVFKRKEVYYAMYADNTAGQNLMRYSTASSPYGPWKEGGIVLDGTGCDTTHGSITEYKGHWYLFYHNCEVSGNGTLRSVCVDEVFFDENGNIQKVVQTDKGVKAVGEVDTTQSGSSANPDPGLFVNETTYDYKQATIGNGATYGGSSLENLHMANAFAQWDNIDGGNGGQVMLTVYYGSNESSTALVSASGDKAGDGYFLRMDKTTGWSDYSGKAVCYIDLNKGKNTVKLTCGMGGVNITGIKISLKNQAEEPHIDGGIKLDGYQISATAKGMRTVYSVEPEIDGKRVVSSGMIYSLSDFSDESSMYIGSGDNHVKNFVSTSKGLIANGIEGSNSSMTYAMTMKFVGQTTYEFTTQWMVRAYAKLDDGSYVYSNVYKYMIFDIAKELYQKGLMNNEAGHNYLYNDILSVVDKNYLRVIWF